MVDSSLNKEIRGQGQEEKGGKIKSAENISENTLTSGVFMNRQLPILPETILEVLGVKSGERQAATVSKTAENRGK